MPSVPKRTLSAISSPSQSKDGSNHLDGKEVIINTLSSYMLSKDSICVQLEQITRYRDLSRHYSINIR